MIVPDGNEAVRSDIPAVVDLIVRTAKWVNPQTFQQLPVWCPYVARGQPLFDATWSTRYTNTKKATGFTSEKNEGNVAAAQALIAALDVERPRPSNWTVCHLWGYDDPSFGAGGSVVHDPRFYSCVANMIWLPTSLKGFTDSIPEIKALLRTCSYYLYGWACEHPGVDSQAKVVRSGHVPEFYPDAWPSPARPMLLPPGTAQFTERVRSEILKRKDRWRWALNHNELPNYPRDQVRSVLEFWRVTI